MRASLARPKLRPGIRQEIQSFWLSYRCALTNKFVHSFPCEFLLGSPPLFIFFFLPSCLTCFPHRCCVCGGGEGEYERMSLLCRASIPPLFVKGNKKRETKLNSFCGGLFVGPFFPSLQKRVFPVRLSYLPAAAAAAATAFQN